MVAASYRPMGYGRHTVQGAPAPEISDLPAPGSRTLSTGTGRLTLSASNVGYREHDRTAGKEYDEREDRLAIRAGRPGHSAEDEWPDPRCTALGDLIEAEERGFTPGRDQAREERARE